MKHNQAVAKLYKFLFYVLGKQPDEFGLVPDENGFVKTKDLLKVMGEEEGWRNVRIGNLKEVSYAIQPTAIELKEKRIRAVDRSSLFSPKIPISIPKLLYHPIRQRAYPFVHEKGLFGKASGDPFILCEELAFAGRLGRRIDQNPVILTINTDQAIKRGADIKQYGKLFLAGSIPTGCFNGPPLPKERPAPKKPGKEAIPQKPKTPGSYLLDLTLDPPATGRPKKGKGKHKNEWKRDRKRKSRNRDFG